MRNQTSYQSDFRRYSNKSETSITPKRVASNGLAQNHSLCRKSQLSIQSTQSMPIQPELPIVSEIRGFFKSIVKSIQSQSDFNELIHQLTKQFQSFEKIIVKQFDQSQNDFNLIMKQNQQLQQKITKYQRSNKDLQDKLKQFQTSLRESPEGTPQNKSKTVQIELITKKPYRNISYSFQEPGKGQQNVFCPEDKENIRQEKGEKITLKIANENKKSKFKGLRLIQ
ncbi:hypothetical protein pb186bvf_003968 [Paramecium bursaria]